MSGAPDQLNSSPRRAALAVRGTVLLEVVLALVIFAAAAVIIGSGMNASVSSVERLRYGAHAANLAVTVFSEIELGLRPLTETEPVPFDPDFPDWTCEVQAAEFGNLETGAEAGGLTLVEVIIRHTDGFVYRAAQVLKIESGGGDEFMALGSGGAP